MTQSWLSLAAIVGMVLINVETVLTNVVPPKENFNFDLYKPRHYEKIFERGNVIYVLEETPGNAYFTSPRIIEVNEDGSPKVSFRSWGQRKRPRETPIQAVPAPRRQYDDDEPIQTPRHQYARRRSYNYK